jgi:SAM-dependent methyltransferase
MVDLDHIPKSQGVRRLTLRDQAPTCRIVVNGPLYDLAAICAGKKVVDIGCGHGRNRPIVEGVGGEWVGVEPFEGGAHTVLGSAESLPFDACTFDVAIMDAVLEHVPNVEKSFSEVGRVLRPGGLFVGYVAFMECFHEISYCHLSFKALENYASVNGMRLIGVAGGESFGFDYNFRVLFYPLPTKILQLCIAAGVRGLLSLKSVAAYLVLRIGRRKQHRDAIETARLYYQLECLRQSCGFYFMIEKPITRSAQLTQQPPDVGAAARAERGNDFETPAKRI